VTYFTETAQDRIVDAVKFQETLTQNPLQFHTVIDEGLELRGLFRYENLTEDDILQFSVVYPESAEDIESDGAETPITQPPDELAGSSEENLERHLPGTMIAQEYIPAGEQGILRFKGLTLVRCVYGGGVTKGKTGILGYEDDLSVADVSEGTGIFHDVLWSQEGDQETDVTIALVYLGGWPPGQYRSYAYTSEVIE